MVAQKVTFENLSRNLVLIMKEILKDQQICKLLQNNSDDPLDSQNDIADTSVLLMSLIKPFAFNAGEGGEDRSELRVYYPNGQLQGNQIIGDIQVFFDIVVAKKSWMISSPAYSAIRPYELAHYVTKHFQGQVFDTVGKLRFDKGFVQLGVDEQFDCIRLIATMTLNK